MVAESVAEVHGGDLTSPEAAAFSANLGKYAAVLATGLTGLDPCIGEKTGGNAVENNFLMLIDRRQIEQLMGLPVKEGRLL